MVRPLRIEDDHNDQQANNSQVDKKGKGKKKDSPQAPNTADSQSLEQDDSPSKDYLYQMGHAVGTAEGYLSVVRSDKDGLNPRYRAGREAGFKVGVKFGRKHNRRHLAGSDYDSSEDRSVEDQFADVTDGDDGEDGGVERGTREHDDEEEDEEDRVFELSPSVGAQSRGKLRRSGRISGIKGNNDTEEESENGQGHVRQPDRVRGAQRLNGRVERRTEQTAREDSEDSEDDDPAEETDDTAPEGNDGDGEEDQGAREGGENGEHEDESEDKGIETLDIPFSTSLTYSHAEIFLHVRRVSGNTHAGTLNISRNNIVIEHGKSGRYLVTFDYNCMSTHPLLLLFSPTPMPSHTLIQVQTARIQQYPSHYGHKSQALRFINCNLSKKHTNANKKWHVVEFFVPNMRYFRKKGNSEAFPKGTDWPTKAIARHNDDYLEKVVSRLKNLVGPRHFHVLAQRDENEDFASGVDVVKR